MSFRGGILSLAITVVFSMTSLASAQGRRPAPETPRCINGRQVAIDQGKLFVDGQWMFLKIGKPLFNFASRQEVRQLIAGLDKLQAKGYNVLELNCYWHYFDMDGDGVPDKSLDLLRQVIAEISARGMFASLSVETYGVGGGQLPKPFFKRHPDALAIAAEGEPVRDTEYGFLTEVPSIHSPDYRRAALTFIRSLAQGVDTSRILWFETTVEPQYMGERSLDYSVHARRSYEAWLCARGIQGPAFPEKFPVPESFRNHPIWNQFRAEALADWVNQDAAEYRAVAGPQAYVAVDYLETDGPEMANRNGDSLMFLRHLTSADIIQVNWHWSLTTRGPNYGAYRNVWQVMGETGRRWAVTEHMTLNGSDYTPKEVAPMLENTLVHGTRFGWEFVNVAPKSKDSFALYKNDWSPKPLIAVVDQNWEYWLHRVREVEYGR